MAFAESPLARPQADAPRLPLLVQLHDWVKNSDWFAAGYPRNLGLSFRVDQVTTKVTGGAVGQMQQRPLFPKVQRIPRPGVVVATYNTTPAKG